jgi:hypothetical protein
MNWDIFVWIFIQFSNTILMFERFKYQREYRRNLKKEKRKLAAYRKSMKVNQSSKGLFTSRKKSKAMRMQDYTRIEKRNSTRSQKNTFLITLINLKQHPEQQKLYLLRLIYSALACILTFYGIYSIYQIVTIATASLFSIPIVWTNFRYHFPLHTGSLLYTREALICIFSSGPIISFIIAQFLMTLTRKRILISQFVRFSIMWGIINGYNLLFGALIIGIITRTEVMYASIWLFMNSIYDPSEFILILLSLSLMIIVGRILAKGFLAASYSNYSESKVYRPFLVFSDIIFPWLIGTIVFIIIALPGNYIPFILKTLTPIIILIPLINRFSSYPLEKIPQIDRRILSNEGTVSNS